MLSVTASYSQRVGFNSKMSWGGGSFGLWYYQPSCTLLFQVTTEANVLGGFSQLKELLQGAIFLQASCLYCVRGLTLVVHAQAV